MGEEAIYSLISDLALILVIAAVVTVVFKKLKQPVVLGYIVAGFIVSPHFSLFPSVAVAENIDFWAQIGIIVLLFSLGLEFSFKKLLNVGGSAVVTAGIIVLGMMGLGAMVGKFLGYGMVDSLFLGAMLSMSSTTIILKALTDLNMRQRKFVPMIFAVLIVEDLFAVLLMVVLSSIAVNKSVEGGQLLSSIFKLVFFLVIWFTVGIFMLPTLFKRYKKLISDEMMLIISMGLCFLMAIFSVRSGFSLALGAFVMGSILAGTVEAKRIEKLVSPVKDLFGAVFFISVGMMVNPEIIVEYAGTIALLAVVVVVGMILFGTFGMLASGQPLKNAVESGFALTQIGEFSFIIASMGMSLKVLPPSMYPIIVAVSVITTFTTPFFIRKADPAYKVLVKLLPKRVVKALGGYSRTARTAEVPESREIWTSVGKRYLLRLVLYSVVTLGIIYLSGKYLWPFIDNTVDEFWDEFVWAVITFVVVSPFLFGLLLPRIKASEFNRLVELKGKISFVPLVVMFLLSTLLTIFYLMIILHGVYPSEIAFVVSIAFALFVIFLFTPVLKKRMLKLEHRFIGNANERENRRTGRGNNLVSDMHLAYMTVGYDCPFVGEKLRDADLRRKYGVNVANIERNGVLHPVPTGDMRVFPGDTLGVIGNEEQIERMLPIVEREEGATATIHNEARFASYVLTKGSQLVGKTLKDARLREDYGALLVAVERPVGENETQYISPTPDVVFGAGDIIWVVGDPKVLRKIV